MTIQGWGGVLRYFHIYLGSEHFFGSKFQKSNNFWSMKTCGYFFFFFGGGGDGVGDITKSNFLYIYIFFFWGGGGVGDHFYTFQGFLRSRYRMGIFFGPQNSKYFWVCLIFLLFCFFRFFFFFFFCGVGTGLGVNGGCWVQAYV